jgi:hypothetical protein
MFPEFDIVFGFMIDFFHKLELVKYFLLFFPTSFPPDLPSVFHIIVSMNYLELSGYHLEGHHPQEAQGQGEDRREDKRPCHVEQESN